jgi:hypothetical protein
MVRSHTLTTHTGTLMMPLHATARVSWSPPTQGPSNTLLEYSSTPYLEVPYGTIWYHGRLQAEKWGYDQLVRARAPAHRRRAPGAQAQGGGGRGERGGERARGGRKKRLLYWLMTSHLFRDVTRAGARSWARSPPGLSVPSSRRLLYPSHGTRVRTYVHVYHGSAVQ